MEKIIVYIEQVTKQRDLSLYNWQELVDKVILPKMAGPKNKAQSRYMINDMFMNLLANFPQEISEKNIVWLRFYLKSVYSVFLAVRFYTMTLLGRNPCQ